ncbi:MAG: C25 family cysteine peptidase [Sulfuricaulis sp.]
MNTSSGTKSLRHVFGLLGLLLSGLAWGGVATTGLNSDGFGVPLTPTLATFFTQLFGAISTAPASQIRAPGYRKYLLSKTEQAQDDADKGDICHAKLTLAQVRRNLLDTAAAGAAGAEGPKVADMLASTLEADILNIESLLLSQSGSASCGGVSTPASMVGSPVVTVISTDNTQVTFHISFPPPTFAPRSGNGIPFLEMFMPGMGDISSVFPGGDLAGGTEVGLPELPGLSELLAVPQGRILSLQVLGTSSYQLPAVQLWPFQPPTAAAVSAASSPSLGLPPAPPFTINSAFYASSSSYPQNLVAGGPANLMHGLPVGRVALAGAQYVPALRELTILTGMDVRVSFGGDSSNVFGTTRLFDPDNGAFLDLWKNNLLNWSSVGQWVTRVPLPLPCGEEMMVITSPTLQPAADSFAADRTAHGILTNVFVTGDSANGDQGDIGITPRGILAFIAQQYSNDSCIRPAYALLMGDTTQVPTFEISLGFHTNSDGSTSPNFFEDPVATDMPYGFVHQQAQVDQAILSTNDTTYYITDYNQDLFVGRIPAANLDQANSETATIEAYEDAAPALPFSSFYGDVVGAEFFQPCPNIQANCKDSNGNVQTSTQDRQSFLRSSEFVGTEAQVAGKTFTRVAQDEQNYDAGVTITPLTFDDGTPIPSGINFNGTTSDVINAIDNGVFLIWHSDHGFTNGLGWYEPPFSENDNSVDSLSSLSEPAGELPVIWSSDCDTGKFDTEILQEVPSLFPFVSPPTTNFGEQSLQLLKAVAFVGASRESPIYQDGFTLKGMGTSLFPEEGNVWRALFGIPLQSPTLELGPLLDSAKLYMQTQTVADLVNDHGAQGTVLEYNDLGDPSMTIWRDPPSLYVGHLVSGLLENEQVVVNSAQTGLDGTLVTLIRDGITLGQGVLENGTATITVSPDVSGLEGVTAILSNDGFLSTSVVLEPTPSSFVP